MLPQTHLLLFFTFLLLILRTKAVRLPAPVVEKTDHQAHAKPGGPYRIVDWDRDGKHILTLDATQSHTHYFDHGPPPSSGYITRYQWYSVNSHNLILDTNSPYFTANFFVGVTVLKLVVTDNTGDKADAYTYVSVREPYPGEDQKPLIRRIEPRQGPVIGGTVISVFGLGFYYYPRVYFAGSYMQPDVISDTELRFRAPPVAKPQSTNLYVSTGFGTSSTSVAFRYVASEGNPVKFTPKYVTTPDGKELNVPEITTFSIGPDAKYYAGSLNGYIHVLEIDRQLVVQSACTSENAGPNRSILGLAFHPNHFKPLRVYISTSTIFWRTKDTKDDWDNGKVEVWGRHEGGECLSRAQTLVSGLPVSANDHAVNGLVFRNDGTLLIAVGGTTNAGVHTHGDKIGGIPESPLSSAILIVNTMDEAFEGNIVYSGRNDPGTANIRSGSIKLFSVGLRNVYGMTQHSNGNTYALDNGPNNGFGLAATGCNEAGRQVEFRDKLVHLKPGNFYGHPNWNRGRYDERQCSFVRGDRPSTVNFTAPLAMLESSTNGIIEYTANTFGGKLRESLILSKLSWSGDGLLKMAMLDETGDKLVEEPYEIYNDSGLAIAMGPYGELLMPKIKQSRILGLVPDEPDMNPIHVIAVTPRRGPALGGNFVLVTGTGFSVGVTIFFGELECTAYRDLATDGSSIRCEVPTYREGRRKVSVVAKNEGLESEPSELGEYEYMLS